MAKKRAHSSDSSDSSSEDDVPDTKKKTGKVASSKMVVSSDSDSSSSDDDDDWNAKPKSKAKGKRGRAAKKPAPTKASKKKLKASDSDDSDSSDDDDAPRTSSKGRGGYEEKEEGEVEDMSDNDDDDDDIEEFNDGFDENLMGDEEDQRKLAQMTEKEREQELFNRSEKREVLKTRFEIERKLRLAKKQEMKKNKTAEKDKDKPDKHTASSSGSTKKMIDEDLSQFTESRSVERRRNIEDKRKAKDAISVLKAEREKKKLKQKLRAADVYSDSSDSDSGSDAKPSKKATKKTSSSSDSSSSSSISDDDSDTDAKGKSDKERRRDDGDWNKGRSSDGDYEKEKFNFAMEHLNAMRLSRFKLEKWCHAPFFKDTVSGCYVRIGIGNPSIPSYIVGQIVDVVETPKVYTLGKTRTNKGIKLKHAKNPERVYRMEYVSNSEFSQQEWERWYTKMVTDRCDFPSRDFVERKKVDIQRALNYQFSDADVEMIVAEKEKFKNKPVNFAMKKSQLMKEKEYAELNGEHEKAIELTREIDRLEDEAKRLDKLRTQNIAAISFINERNRMRNIKEAERAIAEEQRAKEAQAQKDDPFTRRKCAPTMISMFKGKGGEAMSESVQRIEQTGSDSKDSSDSGNSKNGPLAGLANNNGSKSGGKTDNSAAVSQDTDDLFNAHNFEINMDFDLPINSSSTANSFSGGLLSGFSNGKSTNGFGDARPNPLNVGANRRSLNLDEYKKKKGLI